MHIDRKIIALIVFIPFLVITVVLGMGIVYAFSPFMILILFALIVGILYRLLGWVEQGGIPARQRNQRKIDRFLNQLDERDLDVLRERLTYQEDVDDEYESLETLLNGQKQKR